MPGRDHADWLIQAGRSALARQRLGMLCWNLGLNKKKKSSCAVTFTVCFFSLRIGTQCLRILPLWISYTVDCNFKPRLTDSLLYFKLLLSGYLIIAAGKVSKTKSNRSCKGQCLLWLILCLNELWKPSVLCILPLLPLVSFHIFFFFKIVRRSK